MLKRVDHVMYDAEAYFADLLINDELEAVLNYGGASYRSDQVLFIYGVMLECVKQEPDWEV